MFRAQLIMIASVILISTPLLAQKRIEHKETYRFSERRETMMDRLELTDEQQSKVNRMRLDFQKKATDLQAKTRIARLDLQGLFMAEKPDRSAIEKTLRSISDLQHQKKVAHVDHLFAVREILTPEQQKLWREHMINQGERGRRGSPGVRGGRMLMRERDEY